ncbi:hypothetical protein MRX96_025678 [Rhipicephalus microplus]
MPDDYAEAEHAFRLSVNELRMMHDYTPFNVANMEHTMVRMDCPASRTNNIIGESSVRIANIGCARRGFTVALAACASGHKLPAFVILKEPSGKITTKAFTKIPVPANVHVTALQNRGMTSEKLQEWLSRVWGPNTGNVRRLMDRRRSLLHGRLSSVGDICPEHPEQLQAECYSLLFDTDSDRSFDGYESE